MKSDAGDSTTVTVTMVNVIAHGVAADVETSTEDLTSSNPGDLPPIALIKASHCDFATEVADTESGPINPSASINGTDDVKAAPKFVNVDADNFRELRISPTVNHGATDPAGTDLAGLPRTLGNAPDTQ